MFAVIMQSMQLQCEAQKRISLQRESKSRPSRCRVILCQLSYVNVNPLRPNSDLSQTSHCNIKSLSVREVMRIENMITQVQFY